MNEIKTVARVDSLWMGHHPMYFKVFVSALAELGECFEGAVLIHLTMRLEEHK